MKNAFIGVDSLSPALGDGGFGGIDGVVSFIVERYGLEAILDILDIGAGPDSVVMEEFRSSLTRAICGFSLFYLGI